MLLALLFALQCPDGTPPPCARPAARPAAAPALSVAILNFENRSRDSNDAYLAEGLADEIASRLGQVSRLSVTSRAMVRRMRDAESTPIPQLGRTLNTSYLVTGTVQGTGQRLRVSVELLRAANGVQAWTETYDRARADLLAIQSDIATAVAGAITGRLLPQERATLARRPTSNPEAYDQYLRATVIYRSGNSSAIALRTAGILERVVALDPAFLQAWTLLSETHGFVWWSYGDRTASRLAQWRSATDRAVALAPDAPETRIAQGYWHYWSARDYATARRHFEAALARDSTRAGVWSALANIERRQGQWDASLQHRRRSLALEPDNITEYINLMQTLHLLRRLDEADTWFEQAAARDLENSEVWFSGAITSVLRGDTAQARMRGDRAFSRVDLEELGQATPAGPFVVELGRELVARVPASPVSIERMTLTVLRMRRFAVLGIQDSARREARELRALQEQLLATYPDDPGYLGSYAYTLAVLGDSAAAVAAADRAAALMPLTLDVFEGAAVRLQRAETLVRAGAHSQAVAQLRELLAIPSFVTTGWLRIGLTWAALRGRPDFEALLR